MDSFSPPVGQTRRFGASAAGGFPGQNTVALVVVALRSSSIQPATLQQPEEAEWQAFWDDRWVGIVEVVYVPPRFWNPALCLCHRRRNL